MPNELDITLLSSPRKVTITTDRKSPLNLQDSYDGSTDEEQNTFVDDNIFSITTHIYDSANASAVLARMPSALVIAEEAAISKFVTLLDSDLWGLIDDYTDYGLQDEDNTLTGWKLKTHTAVNAPTHTPGVGIAYNGTTQYTSTNWNPTDDSGNYLQNDAFFGVYTKLNPVPASGMMIFGATAGAALRLRTSGSTNWNGIINGAVPSNLTTTLEDSLVTISMNATNAVVNQNGVIIRSQAKTATGIPSEDVFIGARNNGGADLFWQGTISSVVQGAEIGFEHQIFNVQHNRLRADLAAI